jgi:hypothetical protein
MIKNTDQYSYDMLKNQLENILHYNLTKPFNTYSGTNDILLQSCPWNVLENAHKVTILRMRLGMIWESIFQLFGYHKLDTGADLINHNSHILMELKNSYNTDNFSSKKYNLQKLIQTAEELKCDSYTLVYGIVNDKKPRDYIFPHDTYQIRYISGYNLLKFVMGDLCDSVINFLQNYIGQYFSDEYVISA